MSIVYDALRKIQDDSSALIVPPASNRRRLSAQNTGLTFTAPGARDDMNFDLLGGVRILVRRRRWIYLCAALMLLCTGVVCIVMTPQYQADAKLEILKQDISGLTLNSNSGPASRGLSDALDLNLTLQTQISVLRSDTLALQVIKALNLDEDKEFRYSPLIYTARARREI